MKAIQRLSVVSVATTAALLLIEAAFAGPIGFAPDPGEMGCILRDKDSAKFLRSGSLDRESAGKAVLNAYHLTGANVIDPCLTGQVRSLPAAVYAALAERHPEKFEPLEAGDPDAELRVNATAAFNAVPTYHYVSVGEAVPPELFFFDPAAITNDGRVYGTAYSESGPNVAVYDHGIVTVFQEGVASTANDAGTIGGFVFTDPENFLGQAALFRGTDVELIPRLDGEIHSEVLQINDSGTALIFSLDQDFIGTMALYHRGRVTPLDFGPDIPFAFFLGISNQGIISGTTSIDGLGFRGFRFDPRTGAATLLHPLPTEPDSWALSSNNRGDVLGYSFVAGGIERVGVWDKGGIFHTYFVEGIPEFPTISNSLTFNDKNLIVITSVSNPPAERGNSYLVPRPGMRLNLSDLIDDIPEGHGTPFFVRSVNNYGNMFGFTSNFFSFLLERADAGGG
jgi:hypothetical protein